MSGNAAPLDLGGVGGVGEVGIRTAGWTSLLVSLSEIWSKDPRAVWSSFAMILASEIGDKTFLIAAILSMRQPRLTVFLGAFSALAAMSVLSSFLGATFPTLLPKALTTLMAALLFFVFGTKMLYEARSMTGEEMHDEMEEALKEVEDDQSNWNGSGAGGADNMELRNVEEGTGTGYPNINIYPATPDPDATSTTPDQPPPTENASTNGSAQPAKTSISGTANHLKEGARNLCGLCFSPIFAQAFVLTFLGEWGDRSQIATIALAAAHNVVLVSLGTIAGHAICTGLAVLGGSALAARISVKHVTFGGSILFILFGFLYLLESISEYRNPTSLIPTTAKDAITAIVPTALSTPTVGVVQQGLAGVGGSVAGVDADAVDIGLVGGAAGLGLR